MCSLRSGGIERVELFSFAVIAGPGLLFLTSQMRWEESHPFRWLQQPGSVWEMHAEKEDKMKEFIVSSDKVIC